MGRAAFALPRPSTRHFASAPRSPVRVGAQLDAKNHRHDHADGRPPPIASTLENECLLRMEHPASSLLCQSWNESDISRLPNSAQLSKYFVGASLSRAALASTAS